MKKAKLAGVFGLALLTSCGSGSTGSTDPSIKASDTSVREEVNSSGCKLKGSPYGGGNGKESDPYLICSVAQLEAMAGSSSVSYFALTNDLDLANEKHLYLGTAITGVFDGRNHVIRNFNAHLEMNQEGGYLFGQTFTTNELAAEIKNLKLENFQIKTNSQGGTAALVGTNGGKIINVHVTGNISGNHLVGGIVSNNFGIIQDSSFSGSVQGKEDVGGITGRAQGNSIAIRGCHVNGEVAGEKNIGGIVGDVENKLELTNNQVDAVVTGITDSGQMFGKMKDNLL